MLSLGAIVKNKVQKENHLGVLSKHFFITLAVAKTDKSSSLNYDGKVHFAHLSAKSLAAN